MGNSCCQNYYVDKNHELIQPYEQHRSVKQFVGGDLELTDKNSNQELVKHIRSTSSVSYSLTDVKRLKQVAEAAPFAPSLELRVISSGKLKNHILKINAMGLQGSLRNAKDGMTYIGCKKKGAKNGSDIVNDFIVPSKNSKKTSWKASTNRVSA